MTPCTICGSLSHAWPAHDFVQHCDECNAVLPVASWRRVLCDGCRDAHRRAYEERRAAERRQGVLPFAAREEAA